MVPNRINTDFKTHIVNVVDSLVVGVFVGHEDRSADWAAIRVLASIKQRNVISVVNVVRHSIVACNYDELKDHNVIQVKFAQADGELTCGVSAVSKGE